MSSASSANITRHTQTLLYSVPLHALTAHGQLCCSSNNSPCRALWLNVHGKWEALRPCCGNNVGSANTSLRRTSRVGLTTIKPALLNSRPLAVRVGFNCTASGVWFVRWDRVDVDGSNTNLARSATTSRDPSHWQTDLTFTTHGLRVARKTLQRARAFGSTQRAVSPPPSNFFHGTSTATFATPRSSHTQTSLISIH